MLSNVPAPVTSHLSSIMGLQNMAHIRSNLDLSDLSLDQQTLLMTTIAQFRQSQSRITYELCLLTTHFWTMKEILGDNRFYRFAEDELGFNKKKTSRLLKMYRVLNTHFSDDKGRFHPSALTNFSQSGLLLLSDDTDDSIIEEVKRLALSGKVTEAMVRELLEQRTSEDRDSVLALTAEIEHEKRRATALEAAAELADARSRAISENLTERVRHLEEQRDQLDEELVELRERAVEVKNVEVWVEVLPKEYISKEHALAAIEQKIHEADSKRKKIDRDVRNAEAHLAQTQTQLSADHLDSADNLVKIREAVTDFLQQFPKVLLTKIGTANPAIMVEINLLGDALVAAGNQLKGF